MVRKTLLVLPILALTGCAALQEAGQGNQNYRDCVVQQVGAFTASHSGSDLTVEKATSFVIDQCIAIEDAFVDSMADLARAMIGNKFTRAQFLHDEEANIRGDLHELAARLVEENL